MPPNFVFSREEHRKEHEVAPDSRITGSVSLERRT